MKHHSAALTRIAQLLTGSRRVEEAYNGKKSTTTMSGVAKSDSAGGKVKVSLGGGELISESGSDYPTMSTTVSAKEGDKLVVSLYGPDKAGKRAVVTGVVGGGDRTATAVKEATSAATEAKETATQAQQTAEATQETVHTITEKTSGYFWHDDSGTHMSVEDGKADADINTVLMPAHDVPETATSTAHWPPYFEVRKGTKRLLGVYEPGPSPTYSDDTYNGPAVMIGDDGYSDVSHKFANSFTAGVGNVARWKGQTVVGKYAGTGMADGAYLRPDLFTVGSGSASDPHTAFNINGAGDVEIMGRAYSFDTPDEQIIQPSPVGNSTFNFWPFPIGGIYVRTVQIYSNERCDGRYYKLWKNAAPDAVLDPVVAEQGAKPLQFNTHNSSGLTRGDSLIGTLKISSYSSLTYKTAPHFTGFIFDKDTVWAVFDKALDDVKGDDGLYLTVVYICNGVNNYFQHIEI